VHPFARADSSPGALPATQEPVTLELVLYRAHHYVAAFAERFSNVVAEERYVQDWRAASGASLGHRELRSDFLLVRVPAGMGWVPYRDVFEVDGTAVRDRTERLTTLFVDSSRTAAQQASAITDESARYNISNVKRTVNEPLLALRFLHALNQPRFRYTLRRPDRGAGPDTWILEYAERGRPTLVRGTDNRDVLSHGRYWIEVSTGRVLRTELQLEDVYALTKLTTVFRWDERFGINVPVEMEERYTLAGGANQAPGARVTGSAGYGRFRVFTVSSEEAVDLPR
jgi:hypothetical protein